LNNKPTLQYLGVTPTTPSFDLLNQIMAAWGSHIPWESVSRISRHQKPGTPEDYAQSPEAFFESSISHGTGGTCFESNFALQALLNQLGFETELAFCDMENEIENPHCAVMVRLDGKLYLADAGYPIPAAFPLDPTETTTLDTNVYVYRATPSGENRWSVTRTSGDVKQNNFILKAEPVHEVAFRTRLLRDHEPDGLFLHEVIIAKTFPTYVLRYSESKGLVRRSWGKEESVELTRQEEANLPATLARLFRFDEALLRSALSRTPLA
jgi:arylamine N-acetyltransferase